MAAEERFFHWGLEFPVAFYGGGGERQADAGFDAVIGNPPYFRLSVLDETQNDALATHFPEIYQGGGDILYYFLAKGIEVSNEGAKLGYIITRYFLESTSAEKARDYLRQTCHVSELVDFGGMQPFESVSIQAIIPILTVGGDSSNPTNVVSITDNDAKYSRVESALADSSSSLFDRYESVIVPQGESNSWTFHRMVVRDILDRMREDSRHLNEIAEVAQSMQSGRNSVLVVSPEEVEEYDIESELLKPIVKSGDVRRYYLEENEDLLIWTEGIEIEAYPNTMEYLTPHKEDLASRYDIQARDAPWWYISNPRNQELFENVLPRILTPYMSPRNRFFLDREGYFNDGGDLRGIFPLEGTEYDAGYLTSLLNSTAGEFYHHKSSKRKDAGKYEYFGNVLNQFPIPEIEFDRSLDVSGSELEQEYQECLLNGIPFEEADAIAPTLEGPNTKTTHDFLCFLVDEIIEMCMDYRAINLSIPDYIGSYAPGLNLDEVEGFQPIGGVSETILSKTADDYEKLQVSKANVENNDGRIVIEIAARYKPENPAEHQTDRWGYTESDPVPAIEFVNVDGVTASLIESFVEYVINEADDGTAEFHSSATKNISLFDRLTRLSLPQISDVEEGVRRFTDAKTRADDIDERIRRTDELMEKIVDSLYGLTSEQVNTMLETHEYGYAEFRLHH